MRFAYLIHRQWRTLATLITAIGLSTGCASPGNDTSFERWRLEADQAMDRGDYAVARSLLLGAENRRHRDHIVLHNLGHCSVMVARQKFDALNYAAAMRELDQAEAYFRRAIDACPGFQPSLEGLNIALELKGKYEEALRHAEWMAKNIGPSPKQQLYLARELEERGDMDAALLRYRQAVAMDPNRADSHVALAIFLRNRGDLSGALAEFNEAKRLNPKDSYVADQVATLLREGVRTSPTYAIGAGAASAP